MVLTINKNVFKSLQNGFYPVRVNFKDGYAEGSVQIKDKIVFTIMDTAFTATADMTWGDWIASYAQGTSGNGIIWVSPDNRLYLDYRYNSNWSSGLPLGSPEDELYDSNDIRQTLSAKIISGMAYGRSSDAPN